MRSSRPLRYHPFRKLLSLKIVSTVNSRQDWITKTMNFKQYVEFLSFIHLFCLFIPSFFLPLFIYFIYLLLGYQIRQGTFSGTGRPILHRVKCFIQAVRAKTNRWVAYILRSRRSTLQAEDSWSPYVPAGKKPLLPG